ncbi:isoleucyl-tRNA synthetase [Rhizoctonia solani]|uniref:isoleucine--tRNA ligase n=1 Tax=Rhizoctonia solani TaxID=456999 RepID=A0A0K6FY27_9AGAM|nr:isoleucyl-tRNA synthetase [Rhizoctonia solani]
MISMSLTLGHALNKILKDIINRFHVMQGHRVHYMPGWDCHGLPIENKALQELQGDARTVPATTIRSAAREVARREMETQRGEFQEFGIMADWSSDGCYRTLDHEYEIRQLKVLQKMVEQGLITRHHRPVYWSPSSISALAEAELEYVDDHRSQAIHVAFPIQSCSPGLQRILSASNNTPSLMIWTTTPWTIPSNMAIAVNAEIDYSVVICQDGSSFIVATSRAKELVDTGVFGENPVFLTETIVGAELIGTTYKSPFGVGPSPVLAAKHVTADSGTGLVHTAPAHGPEDYMAWRSTKQEGNILCPVDNEGKFTSAVGSEWTRLIGKEVLEDGNIEVLRILKEQGLLIKKQTIRHRYPYDWKTKKPVIFRATSQWFTNLDKIKGKSLEALKDVQFYPESARSRLEAFIRERSEWCISRQRTWGVPIPALHNSVTDEALLTPESLEHIIGVLSKKGVNHWWDGPVEDFIPPSERASGKSWRKGTDTIDVWFDSGSSWSLIRDLGLRDGVYADVCLEGSDQHRGWFQSLLLTAISCAEGDKPRAPYRTLITHGFVLDANGKKMSKSLGNVISPMAIIHGGKDKKKEPAYGADVLRLWAATVEYGKDVSLSQTVLVQAAETLRKIRNSARFVLGNMGSSESSDLPALEHQKLGLLERYVLSQLYVLEKDALEAYSTYNFQKVVHSVSTFTNSVLSSFYFDIMKDTLYAESPSGPNRRIAMSIMLEILRVLSSVVAPILPHLAEEIQAHLSQSDCSSIFRLGWRSVPKAYEDARALYDMQHVLSVRGIVMDTLERIRQEKLLRSALEARVDIKVQGEGPISGILQREKNQLASLFIVSDVTLEGAVDMEHPWASADRDIIIGTECISVRVRPSHGSKCPRCWKWTAKPPQSTQNDAESLCGRCQDVAGYQDLQDESSFAFPLMSRNPDGTFSPLAPPIPDSCSPRTDVSIPQFFLDSTHPLRPIRGSDSPWFIEDETGRAVGFEEVRSRTWGLANGRGRWPDITEDHVVCIFSPNNVDYMIAIWGAHRLSLTVSCANPSYTKDELVYQLQATKSKLLFVHPINIEVALEAAQEAGIERSKIIVLLSADAQLNASVREFLTIDQLVNEGLTSQEHFKEKRLSPGENKTKIALYSFSSGTTGRPKAVAIPHHAVIANVIQNAAFVKLNDSTLPDEKARFRKGDVNLGVLPMFHIYGLVYVTHFGLFAGLPLVVIPKFKFVDMLKSIVKYRITHLSLVPPQVVLFCKHPATKRFDLSHCHFGLVGAAPVSAELTEQFRRILPNIHFGQAYGMTETSTIVTMVPLEHAPGSGGVPGSAGRLIQNTIAKVVKPDGTLAGYDEPGELVVTGPQMTLRYEHNEVATRETYVDGWVHTGDEVIINRAGDVFVVDRLKELIKVGGFQVAPAELEGYLLDHPWIDDAGVIGFPDEFSGELPLAFVVLSEEGKKNGRNEFEAKREIARFVSDKKIKYKWLKGGVVFTDGIPKNPSGKILRRLLRDKAKKLTLVERGLQQPSPRL